ncbi:hypothetical protein PUN28_004790 [Cardiocondyla obscurior]|uniref:Uncharacterized protein n=1 Tax=Cardiocondyla obscurior TaxID=286306 RepID=A0AAW2GCK3_9HYME
MKGTWYQSARLSITGRRANEICRIRDSNKNTYGPPRRRAAAKGRTSSGSYWYRHPPFVLPRLLNARGSSRLPYTVTRIYAKSLTVPLQYTGLTF